MPYATPQALRVALEDRLKNQSRETALDLERLRRRVVFERILARLETADPGRWILKGGMALEFRLGDRARGTRDLDLAVRGAIDEGDVARDLLIMALAADHDGDGFSFAVGEPKELDVDGAGRPGWRFSADAAMAGRRFAVVRLDVVARSDEIIGTDRVTLPGTLGFAGISAGDVEAVDRRQHYAEKFHALTRMYGDRPSSRVRDLPDLILLIEGALSPKDGLRGRVEHVFEVRGNHPVPDHIPDPPSDWADRYAAIARELDISAKTLDAAMELLRRFWERVLDDT
jgi:hypothetical protein